MKAEMFVLTIGNTQISFPSRPAAAHGLYISTRDLIVWTMYGPDHDESLTIINYVVNYYVAGVKKNAPKQYLSCNWNHSQSVRTTAVSDKNKEVPSEQWTLVSNHC